MVASQFADDTTVYAQSAEEALRFTLGAVQSEFCQASGARLNAMKTRTLLGGDATPPPDPVVDPLHPWRAIVLNVIQEDQMLNSLRAVYSPNLPPLGRFDAIIDQVQLRMMQWQGRHPPLHYGSCAYL